MMIPLYVLVVRRAVRRPDLQGLLHRPRLSRHSGRARSVFGADNHILNEMHEIPCIGRRCCPSLMMVGGFVSRSTMSISSRRETPARLAARFNGALPASCSTNGTSTSSMTSCSCARPSGSAACSGRAATARSSTGSARTASPPACSTARAGSSSCRPATSINYAFAMLIGLAAIITWYLVGGVH